MKKGIEQAKLILKLYELRRETVMREARGFVGGAFGPKSAEEFVAIVTKGSKETGFVLQVYGYWDMVCAFVLDGMLSEPLVYDTCQEMYFQWAKIAPHVDGFREALQLPEWMSNIEKVVNSSAKGTKRIVSMRKNLEKVAAEKAK
jgi:hypothetical protein